MHGIRHLELGSTLKCCHALPCEEQQWLCLPDAGTWKRVHVSKLLPSLALASPSWLLGPQEAGHDLCYHRHGFVSGHNQ